MKGGSDMGKRSAEVGEGGMALSVLGGCTGCGLGYKLVMGDGDGDGTRHCYAENSEGSECDGQNHSYGGHGACFKGAFVRQTDGDSTGLEFAQGLGCRMKHAFLERAIWEERDGTPDNEPRLKAQRLPVGRLLFTGGV